MSDHPQPNGARRIANHVGAVLGAMGIAGAFLTIGNYAMDWKLAATLQVITDMKGEWVQTRELQSRRGQELIDLRTNERHLEDEVASLRKQVDGLTRRRR